MKALKIISIIIGAVVITALGIDAADTFNGSGGTLLGQLIQTEQSTDGMGCPVGMIAIEAPTTFTCVDQYEASLSAACAVTAINARAETTNLFANLECQADSRADALPWVYITREEAMIACARASKRLPTALEWYQFALGTPDTAATCNTAGGQLEPTGSRLDCVAPSGVFDAVGNAWEWTTDDVFDGVLAGRSLPPEGYVASVDQAGIAVTTSATSSSEEYGADYILTDPVGGFGLMRGGFYGSREDAGVYAVQATAPSTVAGAAVGFRCVQ